MSNSNDETPQGLVESWEQFREELPQTAMAVSILAEHLLAMDRITPEGVGLAVESNEMREMEQLLGDNPRVVKLLQLDRVNPQQILRAVDLYATHLIFSHERAPHGAK
mgnify:FL=1